MRRIAQKPNHCWLACMCMLHDHLDYDELSRTYPTTSFRAMLEWSRDKPMPIYRYIREYEELHHSNELWSTDKPTLGGKGILYGMHENENAHAVVYNHGWVIDPKWPLKATRLSDLHDVTNFHQWAKQPRLGG